ncbi:MAG: ABC transporter ATP-binding protein [Muribaculaceae bacterium]|nr:ABC transporter ATP-binding protein [Muribaculaceae bacterium]MDE6771039.1 ABC transporter ATP-binding protein [Muribaculaceae bacterium]
MIEIRNVTKSYGPLTILHDVSLNVPDGEIMAIVGPSGAGKTTLLQIAGSLDRPDSGKVIFDGTDIFSLKDKKLSQFRNSNIGFIFQFHQLLPEFSALENVAMPALIAGMKRKEAFANAETLLKKLGLAHRLTHKPAELSGGEKQRAAIARALINNPEVVFADEPTGSLDSRNRKEIQEIISELRLELSQTFVIVTHDRDMASIADRVVEMADGRIVGCEASANVMISKIEKPGLHI